MASVVANEGTFGAERDVAHLTGKVLLFVVGVEMGPQDVHLAVQQKWAIIFSARLPQTRNLFQ